MGSTYACRKQCRPGEPILKCQLPAAQRRQPSPRWLSCRSNKYYVNRAEQKATRGGVTITMRWSAASPHSGSIPILGRILDIRTFNDDATGLHEDVFFMSIFVVRGSYCIEI